MQNTSSFLIFQVGGKIPVHPFGCWKSQQLNAISCHLINPKFISSCPSSTVLHNSVVHLYQRINDMNWIQRKIYLYNVTFGLYMLDWWERYLFNTLVIVLMWFIFYNGTRYLTDFYKRYEHLKVEQIHRAIFRPPGNTTKF